MLKDLSKDELLRLMRAYDNYIKEFFEIEEHEDMIPVCIEEYYNNEYSYYLEVGDEIRFYKEGAKTLLDTIQDLDLHDWLMSTDKKIFKVVEVDNENGLFWIEDCEYAISIDENWSRVDNTDELEYNNLDNEYLKQKFRQEFIADRVIEDIMDLCDNKKINTFMKKMFRENCDIVEFREMFSDLGDEEFIDFMNKSLGFNLKDIEDYEKMC